MRELYPEIEPFDEGYLKVSDLHTVHYEQVGNPKGKKAVFFHGGPGGGLDPDYRRYFDPQRWHVVLFDQRGSGKSTPHAELRENTTWDLVADAERLREKLGIDKWLVFGGSWGSTLGLAYAETHPERCTGLVLRGIFLLRRKELLWFYQEGASWLFPGRVGGIPEADPRGRARRPDERVLSPAHLRGPRGPQRGREGVVDLGGQHQQALPGPRPDRALRRRQLRRRLRPDRVPLLRERRLPARPRRSCSTTSTKVAQLPGTIVQGRYDVVCPAASAWALHKRWPKSKLVIVKDAGHSMKEPGIRSELVQATDDFANL